MMFLYICHIKVYKLLKQKGPLGEVLRCSPKLSDFKHWSLPGLKAAKETPKLGAPPESMPKGRFLCIVPLLFAVSSCDFYVLLQEAGTSDFNAINSKTGRNMQKSWIQHSKWLDPWIFPGVH